MPSVGPAPAGIHHSRNSPITWSTRIPPACRRIVETICRKGAYAVAASRSGRHGGWFQSCPFWLYGSGGAPTVIPPA